MVINGIDRVKISVEDMAASVAFFRDTMEMAVVADTRLDAAAFQRLWRLPACTAVRAVCLKNAEQSTMIELVDVTPNSGQFIRDGAKTYDYGLLDVAFRAKNLEAIYADLRDEGFKFLSAPVVYTADWAHVTVKEVILIGPNRMPVALIERLSEPKPVIHHRFGTLVDVAQYVPAMDRAIAFYTEVLGYTCVFNDELPEGLIDEVVALPPGSRSRLALLYQTTTRTPAVELIHCTAPGRSLAAVTDPSRYGLFAMAFETLDLDGLLAGVVSAGYAVLSSPIATEIGVHGRVTAATVRGPNDVLLEFFSR